MCGIDAPTNKRQGRERTNTMSTFTEINPQQLATWLASGECTLIDVREPDEFARERIAGSTNSPLSRMPASIAAWPNARRLVFQCKAGRRSADAAGRCASLAAQGIEVHSLAGGIEAWKAASQPLSATPATGPALSVPRQTQIVIGLIVLSGVLLGHFVHPGWLILSGFMGTGLIFAGLSGTCGLASLLALMPWNRISSCNAGACRCQ